MSAAEQLTGAEWLARSLAANGTTHVFGLRGIRVEQPSQLAPALQEALASDKTVVVDVATDIDCRAPEPWLPAAR
jgi:thiamine pyrophosphate-dependent acetolactate synthase large subunit-like protein